MADDNSKYSSEISKALSMAESVIYLLAAIFLILIAFAAFFVTAIELSRFITEEPTIDIVFQALNDLLVILIIVELIQTIVVFVQRHQLDLRLILAAGLTAMIRRVLVFGVESIKWEEMAVTAVLLIALVAAIFLIGRQTVETPR